MTNLLLSVFFAVSSLYSAVNQMQLMKDLDRIELDVSRLQEEVDTLNSSIKSEADAIDELELGLQIKNEAMVARRKLIRERLRGLLFYSVPEKLKFILTVEDFDLFSRGEVIVSKMLKDDVMEYRSLNKEMEGLNDLRVVIHEEKLRLEESRKNLFTSLDRLKFGLDRKRKLLARVRSTEQGYRALVKRFEKGAMEIGGLASSRGKVNKAKAAGIFGKLYPPLIKGKIIKGFGRRWNSKVRNWIYNRGITVKADYGRKVCSISDGTVRFSGWILSYGKVIIVRHRDNLFSVYAHLAKRLFKVGDKVNRGAVIAYVGDSGSIDKPSLYFELRSSRKSIDPTPLFN